MFDRDVPGREVPCTRADPELWFAEHPDDLGTAKALCGRCAVRRGCLARALERAEPHGVWGGELFDGGTIVATKRPRGRPRKDGLPPGRRTAAA